VSGTILGQFQRLSGDPQEIVGPRNANEFETRGVQRGASIIHLLLGVAGEVPAGREAELRKQRVGTGLGLGRIGDKFSLAILLRHGQHFLHVHGTELLAAGRDAIGDRNIVAHVNQQQQSSSD
jgi:hypothetical protein